MPKKTAIGFLTVLLAFCVIARDNLEGSMASAATTKFQLKKIETLPATTNKTISTSKAIPKMDASVFAPL